MILCALNWSSQTCERQECSLTVTMPYLTWFRRPRRLHQSSYLRVFK
uniref:Uncharacterized protein n=1 Tax=Anguilla anguilla TaxID=7936 RepID=A0A0E9SYD8_ANGAN